MRPAVLASALALLALIPACDTGSDCGTTDEGRRRCSPAQELLAIALDPLEAELIAGGDTVAFRVIGTNNDHTTIEIFAGTTWSSSNEDVATIDADGVATSGDTAGQTTITVEYEGFMGTATVTVEADVPGPDAGP